VAALAGGLAGSGREGGGAGWGVGVGGEMKLLPKHWSL